MYFQILYVTATGDPQPAGLEGKIPLEEMVYTEGGEMESYFIQNIRVEFTVSLVHSRKLSIRAMVEMEIGREKLEDEETTVDIDSPVPIYKKLKNVNLLELHTTKKDTYPVSYTHLDVYKRQDTM